MASNISEHRPVSNCRNGGFLHTGIMVENQKKEGATHRCVLKCDWGSQWAVVGEGVNMPLSNLQLQPLYGHPLQVGLDKECNNIY